jgi:MoaA/NifB/PqqE/SkfB family radical SAM enzyme
MQKKNWIFWIKRGLKFAYRLRKCFGKIDMLYLEVTHFCNLRCVGCYTNAGMKKEDELTFQEQQSVIQQAKNMGARYVSLSGSGEPLLYKNIFRLIDYIKGLNMGVVLFTNGTAITKETAAFLMSRNVTVYFKLYSLDSNVFDRMVNTTNSYQWVDYSYNYRGINHTRKIPLNLKHLLDVRSTQNGKKGLIGIETVIMKINYPTIPEVAQFAKEMALPFYLETPVVKNEAIDHYADMVLSADEYHDLYYALVEIFGEKKLRAWRNQHCEVERNPVVWTNGKIGLCSSRGANIGNVRDVPLRELFLKAQKNKKEQDALIAKHTTDSKYFRRCSSRRYHEIEQKLPCNY